MTDINEKQLLIVNGRKERLIDDEHKGPPVWLISFTDVIALMLTFFVLLYAMSDPDPKKMEHKVGVTGYAEAEYSGAGQKSGTDEGANISRMDFALAEDLKYVEALLTQTVADRNMSEYVRIEGRKDILLLYLHPSMQTNNRDFLLFLNALEPFLESLDNRLEIVGKPDATGIFEDMQTLGRILQSYGYKDAISLTVRDLSRSPFDSRMAIAIRSNDGRRIAR